jgi:hypothetical protein
MIWNVLLLILLIVFLTPMRLDIRCDDRLTVNLCCFGIKKGVGRRKVEKPPKKDEDDESGDEKPQKNKRARSGFLKEAKAGVSFWETKWRAYSKLLKLATRTCCKLRTIELTGSLFCIDVAWTGFMFGLISSVLATLKPRKHVDVTIAPEFVTQKTDLKFFFSAYVWLTGLVCWVIIIGIKFLIDLARFRKIGRGIPGEE